MALPGILDPEADFGLPKENYAEVRNRRTDFDMEEYERLAVAVSMLSYTAPRAWAYVAGTGTVLDHRAVWGESSAVVPTVTVATGVYTVTFPASVEDLNPTASSVTTSAVQFNTVGVTLHEAGIAHATAAANVLTVYTAATGGTAAAKSFTVFGYY